MNTGEVITINTLQQIREIFDCNRNKAEKIEKLIKEIAVEGFYEHEERQAIENEDILEDEGEWEIPF